MNEWVSVKDRLPDKEGKYLCYFKTSYGSWMRVVDFSLNLKQVDEYDFSKKNRSGWYGYDSEWGYFEHDNVSHWMYLPSQPKEED